MRFTVLEDISNNPLYYPFLLYIVYYLYIIFSIFCYFMDIATITLLQWYNSLLYFTALQHSPCRHLAQCSNTRIIIMSTAQLALFCKQSLIKGNFARKHVRRHTSIFRTCRPHNIYQCSGKLDMAANAFCIKPILANSLTIKNAGDGNYL